MSLCYYNEAGFGAPAENWKVFFSVPADKYIWK